MRKAIVFAACAALTLAGCGGNEAEEGDVAERGGEANEEDDGDEGGERGEAED